MFRIGKYMMVILGAVAFIFTAAFQPQREENKVLTKEQLGEKLFFDPVLSKGIAISCASCHIPTFAFADTAAFSIGDKGTALARSSPSLTNLSGKTEFFWDGRA
jgi:cytochrome c peroxidase